MSQPSTSPIDDLQLQRLALALAETCVRNTLLEDLHAGVEPDTVSGDFKDVTVVTPAGQIAWRDVARISQAQMKALMIEVVDRIYTFLKFPDHLLQLGAAAHWNRPRLDARLMAAVTRRAAFAQGVDPAKVWAEHPPHAAGPEPARPKVGPDDLLALAQAPQTDEAWAAKARTLMIEAADAWTWDRIGLDDLDFIADAE